MHPADITDLLAPWAFDPSIKEILQAEDYEQRGRCVWTNRERSLRLTTQWKKYDMIYVTKTPLHIKPHCRVPTWMYVYMKVQKGLEKWIPD